MKASHTTLVKWVLIIFALMIGYFIVRPQSPDEIRRELKGGWSLYMDCPTTVLNFVDERVVRSSTCGESGPDSQTIKKEGFYEIKGRSIVVTFEDQKVQFTLQSKDGEKKLVITSNGKQYFIPKIRDWELYEKNWF